ncbi:MAG TPA: phosphotriesterase [Cyclobacteriaceae bacterium]|nr:phosphotriesterase [Cyclobacteriaceae bacterium]
MKITRRKFLENSALSAAGLLLLPSQIKTSAPNDVVMTVNGPLDAGKMGFTLTHEHILVDFIGADKVSKDRYNIEDVIKVALPKLKDLKNSGCATIFCAEPAYLGRDPKVLKQLSDESGLNILTNTGYYGAVQEKYLPAHAHTETAEQLAARWIAEFKNGIEGTGIKPGFIKTSTDTAPLTKAQQKILRAAALTHLETGLTMLVHTGNGAAAKEQLAILKEVGVDPSARVWTHAQNEKDEKQYVEAARQNCWVAFDGISPTTIDENLRRVQLMKSENLLDHVLLSHDSGWYNIGEPGGGNYRPYTCIATQFIPKLKENGFTQKEIDQLFKVNPQKAFAIKIKKR